MPEDSWIYDPDADLTPVKDWHGPVSKQNPGIGHDMERAWPFIFGCGNATIADKCGWFGHEGLDVNADNCQCLD